MAWSSARYLFTYLGQPRRHRLRKGVLLVMCVMFYPIFAVCFKGQKRLRHALRFEALT